MWWIESEHRSVKLIKNCQLQELRDMFEEPNSSDPQGNFSIILAILPKYFKLPETKNLDRKSTIDQGIALNNLLFDPNDEFCSENDEIVITDSNAVKIWDKIKHTYSVFYNYRNPQVHQIVTHSVTGRKAGTKLTKVKEEKSATRRSLARSKQNLMSGVMDPKENRSLSP